MTKTEQIRDLAAQVNGLAGETKNLRRREDWEDFNDECGLDYTPILISIDPHAWREIFPAETLGVVDPVYRHVELELRKMLWYASLETDMVIEPWVSMNALYHEDSIYWHGVEMQFSEVGDATIFNGEVITPADVDRMHVATPHLDGTRTLEMRDRMYALIGEYLDVRVEWRHRHLTQANFGVWTIQYIGQQRFLEWCASEPAAVMKFMDIMAETFVRHNLEMQSRHRLTNNNCFVQDFYPWHGFRTGDTQLSDLWLNAEAQDFQCVSPEMMERYYFTFLRPVCEMFGKVQFGCCESLNGKLEMVKTLPNLRRVTISERTDWDYAIRTLRDNVVYSVRPCLVDTMYVHNDKQIRDDIRHMASVFQGLRWELNFPGPLTFNGDTTRLHRFVKIAREALQEYT